MSTLLGAAVGGAIGAALRYILGEWLKSTFTAFAWGTLIINAAGSLLLGWFTGMQLPANEWSTFFLTTGLCGGFTTFSTFVVESLSYGNGDNRKAAVFYILLTVVLCPLFFMAGHALS
jgi:CrcB protein